MKEDTKQLLYNIIGWGLLFAMFSGIIFISVTLGPGMHQVMQEFEREEQCTDLGEIQDFQVSSGFWSSSCTVETTSTKIALESGVCTDLQTGKNLVKTNESGFIAYKLSETACRS